MTDQSDRPLHPDAEEAKGIAEGIDDMIAYLSECDSEECLYTWKALMKGSVLLYDFKDRA